MFEWADYLYLADELVARTGDDAALRSAISRAYYASYGTEREYLVASGLSIPSAGQGHAIVWTHFHNSPDPVRRRIADVGRRLRKRRGRADYDKIYPQLLVDATRSIQLTRQLLVDLANLP